MKETLNNNGVITNLFKSPLFFKISIFLFLSISFFFLGLHSSSNTSTTILSSTATTTTVALSPNLHHSFNLSLSPPPQPPPSPPPPPPPTPPSPSSPKLKIFGVVDESGTMTDNFEIGEYDPKVVDDFENATATKEEGSDSVSVRVRVSRFAVCEESLREYIPCMDNVEAIKKLNSTENGERFERHCPEKEKEITCLVPPPKNYKTPIPWPRSRDEV